MQQDRYNKKLVTYKDGTTFIYTFDKLFFSIGVFILLLFFIFLMVSQNGLQANKNFYVECIKPMGLYCENPVYNNVAYCGKVLDVNSQLCTQQFMVNGESIGIKPPSLLTYITPLTILYIVLLFFLNHIKYNRGFKFKGISIEVE